MNTRVNQLFISFSAQIALRSRLSYPRTQPSLNFEHNSGAIKATFSNRSKTTVTMLDVVKSGLLGLDRKAMEEERLARVRKRAAAIGDAQQQAAKTAIPSDFSRRSVSPKTNPFKKRAAENLDSDDAGRPSKALRIDNNNDGQSTNSSSRTANPQPTISQAGKFGVCATNNTDIRYPNGAVKRSCSTAHDPSNTVTLSSVLQSSTLTTAVISSWQMDFDYLATKIDPKRTKFVFVLEAKTPTDKTRWQQDFAGLEKSIRLCFPPISGNLYARMHSKLMLLFHKSHLRIVVTSANMTAHDWGESGLLENMVFLIDLPRHAGVSSDSLPREKGSFEQELLKFMDATGLPDDVKTGVSNFDFSATHNMAFTHSIPGNYETNGEHDTGILGLAKVVRHLRCGAAFGAPTSIDVASASLGGLDDKQISTFASAFKGVTPFAETTTQKPPPGQAFNIVFPTHETVKNSRGGENVSPHLPTPYLKLTTPGRRHNIPPNLHRPRPQIPPSPPPRLQIYAQGPTEP